MTQEKPEPRKLRARQVFESTVSGERGNHVVVTVDIPLCHEATVLAAAIARGQVRYFRDGVEIDCADCARAVKRDLDTSTRRGPRARANATHASRNGRDAIPE